MADKKKVVLNVGQLDLSKMTKSQLKTMTNKKQRQEWKKAKKSLQRKTAPERAREVLDVRERLAQIDIDDKFGAVRELFAALDQFVVTGETASGTIAFPECPPAPFGRNIVYHFSNIKGHKGTCDLIVRDAQQQLQREADEAALVGEVGDFQKELEQAMVQGTLFPQGMDHPDAAKVIESLLEQAKKKPTVVEVLEE